MRAAAALLRYSGTYSAHSLHFTFVAGIFRESELSWYSVLEYYYVVVMTALRSVFFSLYALGARLRCPRRSLKSHSNHFMHALR